MTKEKIQIDDQKKVYEEDGVRVTYTKGKKNAVVEVKQEDGTCVKYDPAGATERFLEALRDYLR